MIHGLAILLASLTFSTVQKPRDILLADFEGRDYGQWTVTGDAFGSGPAQGTLAGQMAVSGYLGRGLVNTFLHGDGSTGTLTSPEFTIERRYITFLIGGGMDAEKLCVNLIVQGKVIRSSTGPNDRPGGSEALLPEGWNVRDYFGKRARIEIMDKATGPWGHINVDQIVMTDSKPPLMLTDVKRDIVLNHRFLNFPVKNGAPKRKMTVTIAGEPKREFEIELADGKPDWWAFMDIAPFQGKHASINVDKLSDASLGLKSIDQSDKIKGSESLYSERLRPQFHFSPRRGWTNDPNGLVYYKGEYHLFFQHNPYGWGWGNMHWGHAVSPDLVHWTELPVALYPDEHGTMYSGSAVVDWNNTAGFQTGSEKTLVCIFAAAGDPFTQGLAYSNDRGRTWTKYKGNPVVPNLAEGNRDPKVIWYEPGHKWIMALYLTGSDYALLSSKDLKTWERMSTVTLPGASECPEFFEIPVAGHAEEKRWVFYGGNGLYVVGRFDGKTFTSESVPRAMEHGNAWYASQTYTDIPAKDGRRILIGWGQVETPGMPFNQMMSAPVELTLHKAESGFELHANPVREYKSLISKATQFPSGVLNPSDIPLSWKVGELLDVHAEIALGTATELELNVRGVIVSYNVDKQELACLGKHASLKPVDGKIRLRIMVDRTSVDIFGNDGALYMPMGVLLDPNQLSLTLHAKGGLARVLKLQVNELKSAWGSKGYSFRGVGSGTPYLRCNRLDAPIQA